MLTSFTQSSLSTKGGPPAVNGGQFRGGATQQKDKKAKLGEKAPSIHILENEEQAQTCFREVEAEKRRLRSIDSEASQNGPSGGTARSLETGDTSTL